jgi:hypothetical protein
MRPAGAAAVYGGAVRVNADGLPVEELVTAVRNVAEAANVSDRNAGRDIRITGLELTLHAVATRTYGSKVEFRIPFIGMPVSVGTKITSRNTHRIQVKLVPPELAPRFEVRGGAEVEETLLEAVDTIRAILAAAAGAADSFVLHSGEVELAFTVTDTGSITLVGVADLADDLTHTLKLTLGPVPDA